MLATYLPELPGNRYTMDGIMSAQLLNVGHLMLPKSTLIGELIGPLMLA